MRSERNGMKQGNIQITAEMFTQQTRKCSGPNRVWGYWLKSFPALHERLATQMDDMINNEMDISKHNKVL